MSTTRKTTKETSTVAPKVASATRAAQTPKTTSPRTSSIVDEQSASATTAPTHDDIARRAYQLWQSRGGQHGSDADDWRRAEEELRHGR